MVAWLNISLIVALGAYAVLTAGLWLGQRKFLYHPTPVRIAPATAGLPEAEEVRLPTPDGETLIVWYVPPRDNRPVVLFFHGNADTLEGRAARFKRFTAEGIGIVAPAFRGYSGSTGSPEEQGLYRDATAAYSFAAERYDASRIAVWGFSLGSGVATRIASTQKIGKLVLEAPFTSMVELAESLFPIIPVDLLIEDRFESHLRIGWISAPLLVLHGGRDRIVPLRLGQKLFALAPQPKRLVVFPEGDHADLDEHGAATAVLAFLLATD